MSVTDFRGVAIGPDASGPVPATTSEPPTTAEPLTAGRAPTPAPAAIPPGTKVQVRRKFDDKWATGFEVAEATAQGYRIRRLSDGELIPVPIAADDLRKEKKRSNWWY